MSGPLYLALSVGEFSYAKATYKSLEAIYIYINELLGTFVNNLPISSKLMIQFGYRECQIMIGKALWIIN